MLQLNVKLIQKILKKIGADPQMAKMHKASRQLKADGSIVTDIDLQSQQMIQAELKKYWPESHLLGEEMSLQQQQVALENPQSPLWLLDPIDGTSNYSSAVPYFSISLALLEQGQIRFGMVYDPSRQECFWAERGQGAYLDGKPLSLSGHPVKTLKESIALVDFKRLDAKLASHIVSNPPYRSQRNFGSIALEWCWLAAGRGQLYLHGKQKLWDFAAGRLILQEAGGAVAPRQNEQLNLTPEAAIAAINQELLAAWLDFLKLDDR